MTKTQPTHKKLPADRVMHLRQYSDYPKTLWPFGWGGEESFACIATHTPAQAKQIVKAAEFLRLPRDEQEHELACELLIKRFGQPEAVTWQNDGRYLNALDEVRHLLAAMGMGGAK